MRPSSPYLACLLAAVGACSADLHSPPATPDGGGGPADGGAVVGGTFCERWAALAAGGLAGFATDSACADFSNIPAGDVACSGARNDGATISDVQLAQTHLLRPTGEDFTVNEKGEALTEDGIRPKFRLASHRPTLLMVAVTGDGAAPEVKVTASRRGTPLGSLCLKGPATLADRVGDVPRLEESFTVSLPADWIRSGLELELEAGGDTREIPATDLRIAGGLRHHVVEVPMVLYDDTEPPRVPQYMPRMADELPVQSLVWSRFPVPVRIDPFTIDGDPPQVVPQRRGDFDEVREVLDTVAEIQRASGQQREATYFGAMNPQRWGGGLGAFGGASSGPASQLMIRHETGHTYHLPHLEDAFRDKHYPFAKRTDGSGCVLGVPDEDGCGVGPYWKYFQHFGVVESKDETASFASPLEEDSSTVYLRDPMAGGGDNWFGAYTVQMILDTMQDRIYWDDEARTFMRYDADQGDFVVDDSVSDDDWYGRPVRRDTPLYTIFGTFSSANEEVNLIQEPLHYRGNLIKVMDPTRDADLAWLRDHERALCDGGCDLTVRVTFEGNIVRSFLLRKRAEKYVHWAVNVPDEGKITRVELLQRRLTNGGDEDDAAHVSRTTGATFFDQATTLTTRSF